VDRPQQVVCERQVKTQSSFNNLTLHPSIHCLPRSITVVPRNPTQRPLGRRLNVMLVSALEIERWRRQYVPSRTSNKRSPAFDKGLDTAYIAVWNSSVLLTAFSTLVEATSFVGGGAVDRGARLRFLLRAGVADESL
jgi:hypothetical protein